MTPARIAEIRALAEKATPGPWESCRGFVRSTAHGTTHEFPGGTVTTSTLWVAECRDGEAFYNPDGNAAFIAALDPQTVLALLASHAALVAEVETMRGMVKPLVDDNDKLRHKIFVANEARDTAAREMREACAAACDGEPHKMDSEMRGYGRGFGERIRALPLPSETKE